MYSGVAQGFASGAKMPTRTWPSSLRRCLLDRRALEGVGFAVHRILEPLRLREHVRQLAVERPAARRLAGPVVGRGHVVDGSSVLVEEQHLLEVTELGVVCADVGDRRAILVMEERED